MWRNQDFIRKWFLDDRLITKEQQLAWWYAYIEKLSDYIYIIETVQSVEPIGALSLYKIEYGMHAEFGRFMIGNKNFQNKKLGAEALNLILSHGFERLQLQSIYLTVLKQNDRAIKLYRNVGFQVMTESEVDIQMCLKKIDF